MSSEMLSKRVFILYMICVQTIFASELNDNQNIGQRLKETVYDINLFITVPVFLIVLTVLLSLTYCLFCLLCQQTDPPNQVQYNPVFVQNRSQSEIISIQTTDSHDVQIDAIDDRHDIKPMEGVATEEPVTKHQMRANAFSGKGFKTHMSSNGVNEKTKTNKSSIKGQTREKSESGVKTHELKSINESIPFEGLSETEVRNEGNMSQSPLIREETLEDAFRAVPEVTRDEREFNPEGVDRDGQEMNPKLNEEQSEAISEMLNKRELEMNSEVTEEESEISSESFSQIKANQCPEVTEEESELESEVVAEEPELKPEVVTEELELNPEVVTEEPEINPEVVAEELEPNPEVVAEELELNPEVVAEEPELNPEAVSEEPEINPEVVVEEPELKPEVYEERIGEPESSPVVMTECEPEYNPEDIEEKTELSSEMKAKIGFEFISEVMEEKPSENDSEGMAREGDKKSPESASEALDLIPKDMTDADMKTQN